MDLDDSITIATPEGLELHLQLAGLGSRFIAGTADLAVQVILTLILALVTGVVAGTSGAFAVVYVIGAFVITLLYPILFELLHGGRTPGKQLTHLRVIRDTGAPVDLPASAIRNLMRLIDGPLLVYLPTIVSIVVTRRNQRPGDLAAGTVVTRESAPSSRARRRSAPAVRAEVPAVRAEVPAVATAGEVATVSERWDASAVTAQETAAIRRFLDRRESLDAEARRELAARLAGGLRVKVTAPASLDTERFLEELVRVKRSS